MSDEKEAGQAVKTLDQDQCDKEAKGSKELATPDQDPCDKEAKGSKELATPDQDPCDKEAKERKELATPDQDPCDKEAKGSKELATPDQDQCDKEAKERKELATPDQDQCDKEAKGSKELATPDQDPCPQDDNNDFSDLDSGWAWVVLFASFGTFFLIGNSMYAVGIIHSSLLDRYGEKVALTSWAGAIHSAMMSLGAPLSTAVIDRFSCRAAITSSGVFFVVGYLATAFAETIELAIFTCGIVAGTGAALGYTAATVVVGFNFRRRRNLALGIAVSGMGAGLCALPPVMQLSRDYYGPVGFFIILATMTANIVTFGALCFPSKLELHTHKQRHGNVEQSSENQGYFVSLKPYVNALYKKGMVCLFLCMFFYCVGTFLVYLHLPTFIVTKGFTEVQASLLVSLSGIVSVFGRLLTGIVASRNCINVAVLYSVPMGIVGIATFIYPFSAEYLAGHVIYMVVLGFFYGNCYVSITPMSLKFVGLSYVAAAIGFQFFFGGIGAIIGPVGAGAVVDAGGTYETPIIAAAICIVLAAVFSAVTMCFKQTDNESVLHIEETIEIPEIIQNGDTAIDTGESGSSNPDVSFTNATYSD